MWIQFLTQSDCTISSGTVLTVLKFTSNDRVNMTNRERYLELEKWRVRFHTAEAYTDLIKECLEAAIQSTYREVDEICLRYEKSRFWRLRKLMHKLPIMKTVGRSIVRQMLP